MQIKSDVNFVMRECESDNSVEWADVMECRCGKAVTEVKKISDNKVKCTFSDGDWYYYTPACLEESVILEKGKMYTVNGSTDSFEFLEESKNFVIFEGGIVFKKEGNTFVEVAPTYVDKKWEVRVNREKGIVDVMCDGTFIVMFDKSGCYMIKNVPESVGLPLNEDGAVKVIK